MQETPEPYSCKVQPSRAVKRRRWFPLVVLTTAFLSLGWAILPNTRVAAVPEKSSSAEVQEEGTDFSRFTHTNQAHGRLPCLLCHRRESNSPRPALPGRNGHLPCISCHTQQFANRESPMCTICHTNAATGALKAFPSLKSFNMRFNHALHTTGAGSTGAGCATCHQPARRGVAFSIPAGFNAHATCFQCHAPRTNSSGRDISSCSICHQIGGYRRTPEWAAAYRVGFSHAKHGAGKGLSCNECHRVRAGMPQSRQVTAPVALNHHAPAQVQSCMTCHNGKRAFGGDDFTSCKRCHRGNVWHF